MSFALDVKAQLDQIELKQDCCRHAEYDALRRMAGSVLETPSQDYRERALFLCDKVQGITPVAQTLFSRSGTISGYSISFPAYTPAPAILPVHECCRKAFLRGCFRYAGTVNAPEKSVHWEISYTHEETFFLCAAILQSFGLSGKKTQRAGKFVLYLKDAESVSFVLALIGANKGMLDMETMRVEKEIRNNANRAANCDNANIQKANDASYKQMKAIRFLKERGRFTELPESLQEIGELRLSYPEENLTDLGQMLHPPLSKAGVSHRMKKILQIAELEENSEP